ncbi:hypothetical protein ACF06P_22680 [Streptomyces sp. NPDC015684]
MTLVPLDTVHRCHLAAAAVHHVTEHPICGRVHELAAAVRMVDRMTYH